MRNAIALVAALALPLSGHADEGNHMHDHHQMMEAPSSGDAPIQIRINPEARVSATLGGALPPPTTCGTPVELAVKITNQGFITAGLEARLVGDPPEGARLDFHPEPLKGMPMELRTLRLTLTKPALTDLTIAFRPHNDVGDLGGRDRIHLLMRCL